MRKEKPVLSHSQNFLNSNSLVKELIKKSSLNSEDIIYEIGPGKGIITKQLAKVCSKVIAIEYDRSLYEKLRHDFEEEENVEILFGDFLKEKLPNSKEYKIFSNIPFNITAQILTKITSIDNPPVDSYLIMQEEPAKKYSGAPYYKESLRSLMIKPFFEFSIMYKFKNTDFTPIPKVNIVLLRIKQRDKYLIDPKSMKRYSDFLSYAFSQHGKSLQERLKRVFTKEQFKRLSQEIKFNLTVGPLDLKFEQWLGLYKYYESGVSLEKKQLVEGAEKKLVSQQKKITKIHRNRRVNKI